jgi:hypothetical protein
VPGLINVDFADVRAIMSNSGTAMLGMGAAGGPGRAEEAALAAVSGPLIQQSVQSATGEVVGGRGFEVRGWWWRHRSVWVWVCFRCTCGLPALPSHPRLLTAASSSARPPFRHCVCHHTQLYPLWLSSPPAPPGHCAKHHVHLNLPSLSSPPPAPPPSGIVFNITGGSDLTLAEVNRVSEVVLDLAHPSANVIFGAVVDERCVEHDRGGVPGAGGAGGGGGGGQIMQRHLWGRGGQEGGAGG